MEIVANTQLLNYCTLYAAVWTSIPALYISITIFSLSWSPITKSISSEEPKSVSVRANKVLIPLVSLIFIQKEKVRSPLFISLLRKLSSIGIEF